MFALQRILVPSVICANVPTAKWTLPTRLPRLGACLRMLGVLTSALAREFRLAVTDRVTGALFTGESKKATKKSAELWSFSSIAYRSSCSGPQYGECAMNTRRGGTVSSYS